MTQMGRHISPQNEVIEPRHSPKRLVAAVSRAVLISTVVFGWSQTSLAQDNGDQVTRTVAAATSSTSLPSARSLVPQNFNVKMPETRSTRMLDLNLDFDSIGCLVGEQNCLSDDAQTSMGFSTSIAKNRKKGLDLELVPTASMHFDDESRSAVVGAVVRIGEDLRSKEVASNTWYVFAGADAEALSYSPESATALTRGEFGLSDRIIIGDAQAGVGYRIGSADVSLGYFRREISTLSDTLGTEGFSKTEDAAALSFTWKR